MGLYTGWPVNAHGEQTAEDEDGPCPTRLATFLHIPTDVAKIKDIVKAIKDYPHTALFLAAQAKKENPTDPRQIKNFKIIIKYDGFLEVQSSGAPFCAQAPCSMLDNWEDSMKRASGAAQVIIGIRPTNISATAKTRCMQEFSDFRATRAKAINVELVKTK